MSIGTLSRLLQKITLLSAILGRKEVDMTGSVCSLDKNFQTFFGI